MGVAIFGAVMILLTVAIRMSTVRTLYKQGRSTSAWRYLVRSPTLWVGLIAVSYAISPVAATVLTVLLVVVSTALFGRRLWAEHAAAKATS